MRSTCATLLVPAMLLSACAAQSAVPQAPQRDALDATREALQAFLAENAAASLVPELDAAKPEALCRTARGEALLKWAREAPEDIPQTTYSLYRRFRRTGDRKAFEGPYFAKRQRLCQAVLAAWLGGPAEPLDRVNDLIWDICEESTWVAPAHEREERWYMDLFAAETACELTHVLLLLGDRVPEEVRLRVRSEIDRRILAPYLEHAGDYWWDSGRNNWTGVCAGSCAQSQNNRVSLLRMM